VPLLGIFYVRHCGNNNSYGCNNSGHIAHRACLDAEMQAKRADSLAPRAIELEDRARSLASRAEALASLATERASASRAAF
jgi:hypothetical protein